MTGDWEAIHRLSFVDLKDLNGYGPSPYPLRMRIEGMKSIKETASFSICQMPLKVYAYHPALMDFETALSSSDFMSLYLYKRKNEGKNEHSHVRF